MTIAQVCFTFAIPGGMWIRREDGHVEWRTFLQLAEEVGEPRADQLRSIGYHGGSTGMWYSAL